jgi:beta-glucosidase
LRGADGSSTPGDVSPAATGDGALRMTALDYKAQEDARRFAWNKGDAQLAITARAPMDLDRETNGDVLLITTLRIDALPGKEAWIGMACGKGCEGRVQLGPQLAGMPNGQWLRIGVSLKCFRKAGADMHHIEQPFVWSAGKGAEVAISRAALGTDADQVMECAR